MERDAAAMDLDIMVCPGMGKAGMAKIGARADPFMQVLLGSRGKPSSGTGFAPIPTPPPFAPARPCRSTKTPSEGFSGGTTDCVVTKPR